MRAITPLLLIVLTLLAQTAGAARPTTRCYCMPAPFATRYAQADAVFTGEATEVETQEPMVEYGNDDIPVKVTFKIDKAYKGASDGNMFLIYSNMHVWTCAGADFQKGKKYLVYAYKRRPEHYETWSIYEFPSETYDVGGACGGIALQDAKEAADDLLLLKDKPVDNTTQSPVVDGVIGAPPDKKKPKAEGSAE